MIRQNVPINTVTPENTVGFHHCMSFPSRVLKISPSVQDTNIAEYQHAYPEIGVPVEDVYP